MDYKQCENYYEKPSDLFDDLPMTVVGCKKHGIKTLCTRQDLWKDCQMSRDYTSDLRRAKYRLKTKRALHSQLWHTRHYYGRDKTADKELDQTYPQITLTFDLAGKNICGDERRGESCLDCPELSVCVLESFNESVNQYLAKKKAEDNF